MADLELVARLDAGDIGKQEATPSGGLRVGARLTRVGVFPYRQPDGSIRRELRHPDEVFAEPSLATLRGASVTIKHPPGGRVTPQTWKALSVGHVSDGVRQDGSFVGAEVLVQDGDALGKVGAGKLHELSCGYVCGFDPTPGVYEGEAYDGVQRNIRYNHVALLPRGEGRAGRGVALRIDSMDAAYPAGMTDDLRNDALEAAVLQVKEATKKADEASARADAADATIADLRAQLAAAVDPIRVDSLVNARLAAKAARASLETTAKSVLGADWRADGKTDEEIRLDAAKALDPAFDPAGKSADYVAAFVDFGMKGRAAALAANAQVQVVTTPRVDSADKTTVAKPYDGRAEMMNRNANAWKGSL